MLVVENLVGSEKNKETKITEKSIIQSSLCLFLLPSYTYFYVIIYDQFICTYVHICGSFHGHNHNSQRNTRTFFL